jgi:hypothetical protein
VVLTIAGSILVTIPLKLVGTAAHQALLPFCCPCLSLSLRPSRSHLNGGGAVGHLGQRHCRRARLVGSLALSWYVSNFGNHNAAYGSVGAVIVHHHRARWCRDQRRNGHQTACDSTGDAERARGYPGAHGRRNWTSENVKIER